MDTCNNYTRCRHFTPPGWGTARTLAPCGRRGRAVQFHAAEYRPAYSPIIIPAKVGMNTERDGNIKEDPDPCHGRRFCPPSSNQTPINVNLKMCPLPENGGYGGGQSNCGQNYPPPTMNQQQFSASLGRDPYCDICPNSSTCPLPRCPPGVKVERTLPIIPARRLQESYFKMPSSSVYKTDYVPRKAELTPSFAPERIVAESHGDFVTESLTKADYKPMPVCPYKKPPWAFRKPREESLMRMNGISSYKTDYVPKEGKPALSAKPEPFIDADPAPMDDKTVYQVEYIRRELPPAAAKLNRKQLLAEVMSTCCPFDGLTVYKRDYIPKRGTPAGSVIDKDRRYIKILSPMDGTTTYKAAYEPFYFDDIECIPAEIYDKMYPPKDKCCDVRCYPEDEREPEYPSQPPVPPCQPLPPREYCPTPQEMLCSPRVMPCIPPITLKQERNFDNGCTTIRVEHNLKGECQEPVVHDCPPQPCKPYY